MTRTIVILLTLATAMLSGCASITGTSNQSMSVQARGDGGAEVPGANCELTNNKGKWFLITPGSVMIHRSNDDMQVLCTKVGFDPGRAAVVSEIKGSMFGNIIFGGGIGAIIDHSNGSAYEYPTFIEIRMGSFSKIEQQKTQDQQAQPSSPAPASPAPTERVAAAPASSATQTKTVVSYNQAGAKAVSTFDITKVGELKPGVSTIGNAVDLFGVPTSESNFDDKTKILQWTRPIPNAAQLAILFDAGGKMVRVTHMSQY